MNSIPATATPQGFCMEFQNLFEEKIHGDYWANR
jgi:hypothetical protein